MTSILGERYLLRLGSTLIAAIVLAIGLLTHSEEGLWLDHVIYDRTQSGDTSRPATDVLIVAVDEASQQSLGPWPWPASILTKTVDQLRDAGARVIAFADPLTSAGNNALADRESSERIHAALKLLNSPELAHKP